MRSPIEKLVIFDTNILPTRYGLDSVVWLMVGRLCERRDIRMCIPDIVVEESVNLRGSAHEEASRRLRGALADLEKNYQALTAYVPDRSEVEEWWRRELKQFFEILPSNGEDAIEAMTREARRQRPAREGRGGRDSLIWLVTRRELHSGKRVSFVSSNTKDFGGSRGREELHPELAGELIAGSQINYHLSLESFLSSLASSEGTKIFRGSDILDLARDPIFIEIYSKLTFSERVGPDYGLTDIELDNSTARISYSIDGKGLCLTTSKGWVKVSPGNSGADFDVPIKVRSWVEFYTHNYQVPISVEVQSLEILNDDLEA